MNALLIFTILAIASPIFGDESVDERKQEKRGVANLGYGNHYSGVIGAHGLTGYSGYGGLGGFGHGYLPASSVYPLSHGIGHGLNHGIGLAPSIAHGYQAAPVSAISPYSHGYNYHAPSLLSVPPIRLGYNNGYNHGYNGLHGATYGHGLNYVNGW